MTKTIHDQFQILKKQQKQLHLTMVQLWNDIVNLKILIDVHYPGENSSTYS